MTLNQYRIKYDGNADKFKAAMIAMRCYQEIYEVMSRAEFVGKEIYWSGDEAYEEHGAKHKISVIEGYMAEEARAYLIKNLGFKEEEIVQVYFDDEEK